MCAMSNLAEQVAEARARSLELIQDLEDAELVVPYVSTINPLLWELCHLAYFQELWVLRDAAGHKPLREDADKLFDSITIGHEERWRLPIPDREACLEYVQAVSDGVLDLLHRDTLDERGRYLTEYSIYHEDMHAEALTYARQTLGYSLPSLDVPQSSGETERDVIGDAEIPGQTIELGAQPGVPFCFDNEKWAHPVEVREFAISCAAVSEGEFAAFVEDEGYARREMWTAEGWSWLQSTGSRMPVYWRRDMEERLECRDFDRWRPLDSSRAVQHVSWYEADAYARWAGRRLPTEPEWELAARGSKTAHANFDWRARGAVDVNAFGHADSDFGCRQMMGNVWEWTSTTFVPYPGFVADMYEDYSQTSFHTRKVLRGGAWPTRSRMMRTTLRNYFQPSRRDVFAGIRTCALDE